MSIVRSIVLSVAASVIATYLLRQLVLRAEGGRDPEEHEGERPGSSNVAVTVVVMPIAIGNLSGRGGPRALKGLKHGMRKWKG